jgi:DNA polymerase
MVAYAYDDEPIQIVDLASGEKLPKDFLEALTDKNIEKHAHNANFERNAFRAIGFDVPIEQWHCSAVKAAYCGLPLSLEALSKAMDLKEKGKLATGKALIKYFCTPCNPSNSNEKRMRNLPWDDFQKWEEFKLYCINDVEAEREVGKLLKEYSIPVFERENYILDQEINDRGILVDIDMVISAKEIDDRQSIALSKSLVDLTGLENPNSPAQLKKWLGEKMQKEITSLAKSEISKLIDEAESEVVKKVLKLRRKSSKTSTKKYVSMLNCACYDERVHGLFQFYGANRTGRWAGRLVQLQNLPQNHLDDLEQARKVIASKDYSLVTMLYENVSDVLSQLIRTAFIAKKDHTFAVADFSAIEARVIAWLANEKWRLEVFNSHGKIYEASASMMFGVPIEEIHKGSELRTRGKIAELALGYQGAIGALRQMGGESMGLSESEMEDIVKKWRAKNPQITSLWVQVEGAAIRAIKSRKIVILPRFRNLEFFYDGKALMIKLPSGRSLFYQDASLTTNRWGKQSIRYKGLDQVTKKWWWIDSYGGKFVENIVQAIARDCLAYSMLRLKEERFEIVMHVHDEAVCEVPVHDAEDDLRIMCEIMGEKIPWAEDLPLTADGYVTKFYKKD